MGLESSSTSSQPESQEQSFENPLMSNETLRRMHAYMVRCREAARRGSKGLEAIEVATLVHMRPGDMVVPIGNGWLSSRFPESPLKSMFREIHASDGEQASLELLVTPENGAGTQIAIATGGAYAIRSYRPGNIAVLLGDRTALGDATTAAMTIAGERKLPIIYVIETNIAAGLTPAKLRRFDDQINALAAECGFPAMPVDGQDAVAVYRVAQESIARARKGGGPTLIDCKTWRGKAAGGSATKQHWKPADPIKHMEAYLKKKGL